MRKNIFREIKIRERFKRRWRREEQKLQKW